MKFKLYYIECLRCPVRYVEEFARINFYGELFRIPKKYDEYLTFMYGNWRIPDKNFEWHGKKLKDVLR